LTQLLETLGREGQPAAAAVAGSVEAGRELGDYLFWRVLLLGLLLIGGALSAAIAYRAIDRRISSKPQGVAL
jgi:hypothetical protein